MRRIYDGRMFLFWRASGEFHKYAGAYMPAVSDAGASGKKVSGISGRGDISDGFFISPAFNSYIRGRYRTLGFCQNGNWISWNHRCNDIFPFYH